MILDDDDGFVLQQPLAALGRVDLHALDVELDDKPLSRRHQALIEQAVERDHLHALARIAAIAVRLADPERLVLGAAEPDLVAGRRADGAVQDLEAAAVELGVAGQSCAALADDASIAITGWLPNGRLDASTDQKPKLAPPSTKP